MKLNLTFAKRIFFTCLIAISLFLISQPVLASQNFQNVNDNLGATAAGAGVANFKLIDLLTNITKVVLGTVGAIFFILFIYGGFRWMTAAGNETKVTKAKALLISAVIGLAIVTLFYVLTTFIVNALQPT